MNRSRHAPAVTSLPQAPQDEATGRVRRYVITMVIRMVCFALTLFVTPYGWYTWVFAIATAVLPYIAVVFANAINPTTASTPESATQQLTPTASAPQAEATPPNTFTIQETQQRAEPDSNATSPRVQEDDKDGEA